MASNFRFFQRKSLRYLRRKYANATYLKRFHRFGHFHRYVRYYIQSKQCDDPRIIKLLKSQPKLTDGPRFHCTPFPEPALPPLPKRRRRRRKKRIKRPARKTAIKQHAQKKKTKNRAKPSAPKPSAKAITPRQVARRHPLKLYLSDATLAKIIKLPRANDDSHGVSCRQTATGIKCFQNRRQLSLATLCDKNYRERIPLALSRKCPPRKPDLASMMKGMCLDDLNNRICTPCITKAQLRDLKNNNPIAFRTFMARMRPHTLVLKECLPRCDGTTPIKPKRINPDGSVIFRTSDNYRPMEKLRFLDRTRAKRLAIRRRWKRNIERKYFASLNARLLKIWQGKNQSFAEKRQTLFELWDECLEPNGSRRGQRAQVARRIMIRFIRNNLPAGSPHAYTRIELATIAKQRRGKIPFNPYGPSDSLSR